MNVVILNRKDAKSFVKNYRNTCGRKASDVEIKNHIVRGARPDGVSWINPFGIFKDDEIPLTGVTLMELAYASKYI